MAVVKSIWLAIISSPRSGKQSQMSLTPVKCACVEGSEQCALMAFT